MNSDNDFMERIDQNNAFSSVLRKMLNYLGSMDEAHKGVITKTKKIRKTGKIK